MNVKQMLQSLTRSADRPPFDDLQPTVEWRVNGFCNYDCSYCIQSKASRVGVPDDETIHNIIGQFADLPGQWEIKMSGGEPFAFKGFVNLVVPEMMRRTRHDVSVLTNFSAPLHMLQRFCELTTDRLRITSASLHPDTADFDAFVDKAIRYRDFRSDHNPHSSFVVNVVLVPGRVRNHFAYRERLQSLGFRYFPQLMKIKGGVYPYDDSEQDLIEQLTNRSHDPHVVNRAPSYKGLHCEAGVWYFTVDQTGEAYSCRTGKKFLDANGQGGLGNLAEGTFKRLRAGGPCPYPICPCTVPANRRIVRIPDGHAVDEVDVVPSSNLVQIQSTESSHGN